MSETDQLFKQAMSRFASGVTVITTYDENQQAVGMTASAFISVSLNPPLILESIAKTAQMHHRLMQQDHYAVSILSNEQVQVSNHFAGWHTEGFTPTLEEVNGLPMVADSLVQMCCRIMSRVSAGDHTLFIAEVKSIRVNPKPLDPLIYVDRQYRNLAETSEDLEQNE